MSHIKGTAESAVETSTERPETTTIHSGRVGAHASVRALQNAVGNQAAGRVLRAARHDVPAPEPDAVYDVTGAPATEDAAERWAAALVDLNALAETMERAPLAAPAFHTSVAAIRALHGFRYLHGRLDDDDWTLEGHLNPKLTKASRARQARPSPLVGTRATRNTLAISDALDNAGRRRLAGMNESLKRLCSTPGLLFVYEGWDDAADRPVFGGEARYGRNGLHDTPISCVKPLRITTTGARIVQSAVFRSEDYKYVVELVRGTPDFDDDLRSCAVDLGDGATYRIVATPSYVGGRSAQGRSYAQEHYAVRDLVAIAALTTTIGASATATIEQRLTAVGVTVSDSAATVPAGFVALPGGSGDPYVFHVAAARRDPIQTTQQATARRTLTPAALAATASAGPHLHAVHQQTGAHTLPRAGIRDPQTLAAGVPASGLMQQPPGTQGRLASHEYAHLVGDGDGGQYRTENLVLATNAANTEQLAIESIIRQYRPQLRALGWSLDLDVTATVTPTPMKNASAPWTDEQTGDMVLYRVYVRPANAQRRPAGLDELVHEQVIDAQRGVITRAEVIVLEEIIRAKMRSTVTAIRDVGGPAPHGAWPPPQRTYQSL